MEKNYFLPAEWHPQSYIQLTWPHSETDWNYMLDDVEACFLNLAREIASRQPLLLVAPEYPEILKGLDCKDNIHYISCPTNDTWARDQCQLVHGGCRGKSVPVLRQIRTALQCRGL